MYPAPIKPDQPSLDRRRRPGELSIPARYASIQRVPTGIRAVSDPQLVGHRLAMELFENPRGRRRERHVALDRAGPSPRGRVMRQFLSDCNKFLTAGENWAGRAAELGWNAATLFGCRRARPLDHPGGAGLLWAINGGRLVELHRDWAVIELAANGSRHVFERRRVDAGNVTLPWIERGRRPGDV